MLAPRTVAIVSEKSKSVQGGIEYDAPQKHVLAACLSPLCVGEEFDKIPPHVTVLPPFQMRPSQRLQFIKNYADVAEDHLPFRMVTLDYEYFGPNNDIKVLPGATIDWGVFAGAACLAKSLGLPYPDEYHFRSQLKTDSSLRLDNSWVMSFGTGDEVDTCGGVTCYQSNRPHITNFEGVIGPGEMIRFENVQLFCYEALSKKVKAIFRRDVYDFEE